MFGKIGRDAVNGALDELKNKLGGIDIAELIKKTPFLRVLPYIYGYWDTLSEEEKQKDAAIVYKAAIKALAAYGG